jgi:23S rRNA pseudouridine2605 synthase
MRGHDRGLEGGEEGGADPRPPGSARAINGVGRRVRWILSHLGSTHAITGGDARFGAQGRGRAGGGRRCQGGGTVDPRMAGGQGGRWGGWRGARAGGSKDAGGARGGGGEDGGGRGR